MIQLNPLRWREKAHSASYADFERILMDDAYWEDYKLTLIAETEPLFTALFFAGARAAVKFPEVRAIFTDDLAKEIEKLKASALEMAQAQTSEEILHAVDNFPMVGRRSVAEAMDTWASGIAAHTRLDIQDAIHDSYRNGGGSPYVLERMEQLFSPVRARRIAVTESTRFFGAGAQNVYQAAKLPAWEWLTVADRFVCSICESKGGELHRVNESFSPAHVGCRCFPAPVTSVSEGLRQPVPQDWYQPTPSSIDLDPGPYPKRGFQTSREAQEWASKRHPHIEWSIEDLHIRNLNEALPKLDNVMQRYPYVTARYQQIGTRPFNDLAEHANAYAWQMFDGTRMGLNPRLWADEGLIEIKAKESLPRIERRWDPKKGDYKEVKKPGFKVEGNDSPGGTLVHEFGHAVDGFFSGAGTGHIGNRAYSEVVSYGGDGVIRNLWHEVTSLSARELSGYAKTNKREQFAEAFAQRTLAPRAKWNGFTKKIDGLLNTVDDPDKWIEQGEWQFLGEATPEVRAIGRGKLREARVRAGLKPDPAFEEP